MKKDITKKYLDDLTFKIIGCAIEVHYQLGPGLLESVYEKCFARELFLKGFKFQEQTTIPVDYKGLKVQADLRLDILVEDLIIVELKAIETFAPIHSVKLLSYMKLLQKPKGILVNFNCQNIFKEGQKTLVNEYYRNLPAN